VGEQVVCRRGRALSGAMAYSSRGNAVDQECRSLLSKLADSTGPVWDGSVIIRLKVADRRKTPELTGHRKPSTIIITESLHTACIIARCC
jgi:hypothetical protein